jgi:hypothetical protein
MAVVRTIADGTYFMTYEICGAPYNCAVYDRTSKDGLDWGTPTSPGHPIKTASGSHFEHTPTTTIVDNGTRTGEIVLVGRDYVDGRGDQTSGDGRTLLVNSTGGTGPWTAIPAPVPVDTAAAPCANYSSTLLPTANGKEIIEIAQEPGKNGCSASYATGQPLAHALDVSRQE